MKKPTWKKRIILIVCLTFVFVGAISLIKSGIVWGKFEVKAPYIIENTVRDTDVFVTDEGGNQKGAKGSGAKPVSVSVFDKDTAIMETTPSEATSGSAVAGEEDNYDNTEKYTITVPECKGLKGSKTNPFVILEIVPDKAQQQMIYLNPDNNNYPFDIMQIGVDASSSGRNFANNVQNLDNYSLKDQLGNWFVNFKYNIYDYGIDEEKTDVNMIYIDKYYTVTLTDDDITEDEYNNKSVADIAKDHDGLFVKDDSAVEIRDIAVKDPYNWKKSKKIKGTGTHYEKTVTSEDVIISNEWSFNAPAVVADNPDAFKGKDDTGLAISDAAVADTAGWTGSRVGSTDYNFTVSTTKSMASDFDAVSEGTMTMVQLADKYPKIFAKDKDGKTIPNSRLKDSDTWKKTKTENVDVYSEVTGGYMYYVGTGNGEYSFKQNPVTEQASWWESYCGDRSYTLNKGNINSGDWMYVENVADIPAGRTEITSDFSNNYKSTSTYFSMDSLKKNSVVNSAKFFLHSRDTEYKFTYAKSVTNFLFQYDEGETKTYYTYTYHNLKVNEVLKRSIFQFADEEECNDFNLQVICVTPSEMNQISSKDTDETVDLIERADMVFMSMYDKADTDNIRNVYELYYKYWLGDSTYTFDKEGEFASYYDNDLEWSTCVKLIKRLSTNRNLPMVWTQKIGDMLTEGVDLNSGSKETYMYYSAENPCVAMNGTLNNVAKTYLITIQFDLLARHMDGTIRTFIEDILPNIKTVDINPESTVEAGCDPNTAKTTGYYVRTLAQTTDSRITQEMLKRSYYLWNLTTFYPEELGGTLETFFGVDKYVEYGYLPTFFNTNDLSTPFGDKESLYTHQSGTDGTDEKNVTIISAGSNSNTNQSTLITSSGTEYVVSNTLEIIYLIMNNGSDAVMPLSVQALKCKRQYVRISGTQVMIDYSDDAKYADKTLYLKVSVSNVNNETSAILGTCFLKEDMTDNEAYDEYNANKVASNEPVLLKKIGKSTLTQILYSDYSSTLDSYTDLIWGKKDISDTKDNIWEFGYPVSTDITFYVPYRLKDWQKGYNVLRVYTKGRTYNQKKNRFTTGSTEYEDIYIGTRELFNLE